MYVIWGGGLKDSYYFLSDQLNYYAPLTTKVIFWMYKEQKTELFSYTIDESLSKLCEFDLDTANSCRPKF